MKDQVPDALFITAQRDSKKVRKILKREYGMTNLGKAICVSCEQDCVISESAANLLAGAKVTGQPAHVICTVCAEEQHLIEQGLPELLPGQAEELKAARLVKNAHDRRN